MIRDGATTKNTETFRMFARRLSLHALSGIQDDIDGLEPSVQHRFRVVRVIRGYSYRSFWVTPKTTRKEIEP